MSPSVLHVLPGLGFGGTEFVVARLAQAERAMGVQNQVLYLKGPAPLAEDLRKKGVPCRRLTAWETLSSLSRSVFPVKEKARPFDVVHGWLYSGNLAAGVLAGGGRGTPVIWNLMQANLGSDVNSPKTRFLMKVGAHFSSRWPSRIVCNSTAALRAHQNIGFDPSKMVVIPNGVDTDRFRPDPSARARLRETYSLSDSAFVIGHLARWDPNKDHRTLLSAFGLLLRRGVDAHLCLAGPGVTAQNSTLMSWIRQTGAPSRVHLLGPVNDAPTFLSGLDVFCLSSIGESSSYALAEAMACGVPAVATDVGDALEVVGATGIIVPPAQPETLCEGIHRLANSKPENRTRLGAEARERIVKNYSFKKMVEAYQSLYTSLTPKKDRSVNEDSI